MLADLELARTEFEAALRRAPDAALRYTPPGADHSLADLVANVIDGLYRFARVADALPADAGSRGALIRDLRSAHAQLLRTPGADFTSVAAHYREHAERVAEVVTAWAEDTR